MEYDNSVSAILGNTSNQAQSSFPQGTRADGFSSNKQAESPNSTLVNLMMTAAETIASQSVSSEMTYISATLKCTLAAGPSASTQDPCAINYITNRGQSFFRRPLTSAEISSLYSVYLVGFSNPDSGVSGATSGISTLIATFLQSPDFFYRTELGAASDTTSSPVQLTQYEIASAISYMATASTPDATLMAAAANGSLSTADATAAQYQRLVATPQGHKQMEEFVLEWLGADQIASQGMGSGPVTPQIASEMLTESQDYIEQAVFNGSGTVNELLTGQYTFVNTDLATYYGLPTAGTTANFSKVILSSASGRAGIMSQGAFLVTTSNTGVVPLLHRGKVIRNRLLCETLPSFASLGLPGFTPPPFQTPPVGTTDRHALQTQIVGNCYTCHQFFMPIGYALENFDAFGQYQTTQNGGTIDPSGAIFESTSIDPTSGLILNPKSFNEISFANYSDLTSKLAADPAVDSCFSYQVASYSQGRSGMALNECAVKAVQTLPSGSGAITVQQQFLNLLRSKYFAYRTR